MCRAAAVSLLVSISSCLALSAELKPRVQPGQLAVVLSRIESATSHTISVLRSEVAATLETTGVRVHWHDGRGDVPGRMAMIHLTGSCLPVFAPIVSVPASFVPRSAEALGITHVTDGQVLSFADIRCDQIRKYVGETVLRNAHSAIEREEMMGRALARVVAHELYHILVGTTKHGKSGIASATQTPEQLVARRRTFSQAEEQAISAAIAPPAQVASPVEHTEASAGDEAVDAANRRN